MHEREGSCSRNRKEPFQTAPFPSLLSLAPPTCGGHVFPEEPRAKARASSSRGSTSTSTSLARCARASRPANLSCCLSPPPSCCTGYIEPVSTTTTVHPSIDASHGSCVRAQPRDTTTAAFLRSDPCSASAPALRPAVSTSSAMAAMPTDSVTRRFAVACGVLSQYVRNGSGAPAMPPPAPFLKQQQAPPAAGQEMIVASGAAPQLTIFYGGRVVVLDACPPEKAAELIRLAAAAAQGPQPPEQALVDMPIARKASLRRFLAKRKDRSSPSSSPAPYDDEPPAPKKTKMARDEPSSSSWLALGNLCSMHSR